MVHLSPQEREALARMIAEAPAEENAAMLEALENQDGPMTVLDFLTAFFDRLGHGDPKAAAAAVITAGPLDFRTKLN